MNRGLERVGMLAPGAASRHSRKKGRGRDGFEPERERNGKQEKEMHR